MQAQMTDRSNGPISWVSWMLCSLYGSIVAFIATRAVQYIEARFLVTGEDASITTYAVYIGLGFLMMSIVQWIIIRRVNSKAYLWIISTGVASMLIIPTLLYLAENLLGEIGVIGVFVSTGAIIGVVQWALLLRILGITAPTWVSVSTVAWIVAFFGSTLLFGTALQLSTQNTLQAELVEASSGVCMFMVYSIFTGMLFTRIQGDSSYHEAGKHS